MTTPTPARSTSCPSGTQRDPIYVRFTHAPLTGDALFALAAAAWLGAVVVAFGIGATAAAVVLLIVGALVVALRAVLRAAQADPAVQAAAAAAIADQARRTRQ